VGQAIGDSIPYAIGVAISPIPIIAIVLMLLSKRAASNGLAFDGGWIVGVAGVTVVVIAVSGAIGTGPGGSPSHWVSALKIALGALLLALGVRDWRKRPAHGEAPHLPKWLAAIEHITPLRSGALALALSVANPKNLVMILGGGLAIAGARASSGDKVVAAVVFVVLAVSTVTLPVILYRLLGARAERTLGVLHSWLEVNNAMIMAVLILVIGVVLIGKGLAGF
jgi:hypothetical protein